MLSTIVRFLKDKGQDLLNKYYSRETIVMGIFRYLGVHEQQIIIQGLSHNPAKIHLDKAHLDRSIKLLQSLGLIQMSENSIAIHPVFKSTLISVLARGANNQFIRKKQNIGFEIESESDTNSRGNEHFEKWVEVYNYILRNIIIKNNGSSPVKKKLKKTFCSILKHKGLKIKPEDLEVISDDKDRFKEEKKKLTGFGFLIQPIWAQINLLIMYYCESLIDKAQQNSFSSTVKDRNFDADLLEFMFGINLLDPSFSYIINYERVRLPKSDVKSILEDLEHVGLIELEEKSNPEKGFKLTKLLGHFLTPNISDFQSFKTNIIVENDFKIYVFSTLEYVRHFMSRLIRSFR
jgi:hypothetical protein